MMRVMAIFVRIGCLLAIWFVSVLAAPPGFAAPPAGFPGVSAPLAVYKVDVTKLDLCRSGTTATNCVGPVTVGTGSKVFDIASAQVGAAVGSYSSTTGLPFGTTFSHIRVTLNTVFTVATPAAGVTGDGGGTCYSKAANGSADPTALNSSGSAVAGSEEMIIIVPNPGLAGGPSVAQFNAIGVDRPANAATMTYTFALASPFSVALVSPLINVKFGTQESLAVFDSGGGVCDRFYVLPPQPNVTIQ